MSTTLITFIGRSKKPDNAENGYPKTTYNIEGNIQEPSAFLGYNLNSYLKPDRIIILGTSGSMWDHLFEGDLDFEDKAVLERVELSEAVNIHQVTQSMLDDIQGVLANKLGIETHLQLIKAGTTLEEQIEVVELMACHVKKGDHVHLDITHGLRHLPMIALLAAMYLQNLRQASIEGIWYGAFELRTDDVTPVNNLLGLLKMADWLNAMSSYTNDGDYGIFSDLLGDEGKCLKEAAFYERINNSSKAKQKLETWTMKSDISIDPVAKLFSDDLQQRIAWHRRSTRHDREKQLAKEYLKRNDYLRASILALEAKISEKLYIDSLPDNLEQRDEASKSLRVSSDFKSLNSIRNALAHGVRSANEEINSLLSDEERLKTELHKLFKSLQI